MLQGEAKHTVPPIIETIVDDNWLVPVQKMQLGLRPVRTLAIVREIISSFISEGHFIGYPGRIIRPDVASAENISTKRRTDEYALDCRIRAAVQTDDIIEKWA
eukprot:3847073-Pyramimonas_sp.AAC.1